MPIKMSTRRANWASEMPASIRGSFFMACALWGDRVCEASDFESAARLARARSIRYWGLSYRDRDLGPEQWRTPGEGPMVPRLAEARHRALTGFEPTVLCGASVPAPVAEPVDAPDSKSGVRKDVPVRVGPGAPRKINDLGGPRTA